MSYKKKLVWLIVIGVLIRCLVAVTIDLGNDEVYYWTYSQHLQWNYFDHPPMVALLIRITTLNLSLQQFGFFVRLGSIICSAFATYFLYKTVSGVSTERAGFLAALFYNGSFYGCVITGIFILPDSPQMLFWTASLLLLSKMVVANKPSTIQWLWFGILTGLTIMSKVHGIFIWTGLLLYILFFKRKWLGLWQLYLAALVCFIIVSPILWWNWQNDFITYRYHSSRLLGVHFRTDNFFREIFGEIFYNNPVIFTIIMIALTWFLRTAKKIENDLLKVCLLIGVPMILLLLFLSMFNDTLPHWTGPGYVSLIPIAAVYLAQRAGNNKIPGILKFSLGFTLFVIIGGVLIINFYPGTLGNRKIISKYGEGDVTLDMYGWKKAAKKIDSVVIADEKNGTMPGDVQFVSNKWFPTAHIDYYIAMPIHKSVIGLGGVNDLHHYAWLNTFRLQNRSLHDAYCVFPSDYNCNVKEVYVNQFTTIDSAGIFPIYRNNKVCKYFFLYRLRNFVGKIPKAK